MPNITPHVCLHTYCSNMAKSGMKPKTLQYLMGHSDIGVTLNTYTHLGLEDATDELKRIEELENVRKEMEKNKEEKARFTENVPGDLNKESFEPCFGRAFFRLFPIDATDELKRMEDLENARKELEKNKKEKPVSQKMFRAI